MKKLIVGNWKMNKTPQEGEILATEIVHCSRDLDHDKVDLVICPPFVALDRISHIIQKSSVTLGAQNLYPHEFGAFTGEINAVMLKDIGVQWVILGHSERRSYFKESDEFINEKALNAQKNSLVPILCVGETSEERTHNLTFEIIGDQIRKGIQNCDENLVIAYEPIWAIGTGMTATPEMAQEVHQYIRQLLHEQFGEKAKSVHILYGGSMKPENAQELLSQPDIDGGLIGGASLVAKNFIDIAKAVL